MSELAAMLRARLGGQWEGDEEECQGLVRWRARALKVELRRTPNGTHECAIFEGGAALATGRSEGALEALREALASMRQSEGDT